MPILRLDPHADRQRDSNLPLPRSMILLLRQRLRGLSLRRRHRSAPRKVAVIEAMGLSEDRKLAAIARVMRRFEETLNRFTRDA